MKLKNYLNEEIGDYWYDKKKKKWIVQYPNNNTLDYKSEREAKLIRKTTIWILDNDISDKEEIDNYIKSLV